MAELRELPIELLRVAQTNTRKDTAAGEEESSISGLAQSIREQGLLNPLTVRSRSDGTFEILAGQRRYLACKELGWSSIPVTVREDVTDTSAVALSLIENVQRADMHPLDKARAYEELRDHHRGNLREVAHATGVSVATVQRYLTLLDLPPELHEELGTGRGTSGVGAMSAIAKTFDDQDDMVEAWDQIGGFTTRIQGEILKRSGGNTAALPELVMQATEGAFDMKRCGTSAEDCPHIPDELRGPLQEAMSALELGVAHPGRSLREFAASHKKRRR